MNFVIFILALFLFFLLTLLISFFGLWFRARLSGVKITFVALIGMKLRKVSPATIVQALIMATKAGLELSSSELEAHFLAGGNVNSVVLALIAASKANIPLTFRKSAAIDLAGRNVLEAVQTSVNPKVIDCPSDSSGKNTIEAVAGDGIQLKAKARVTVRANLDRLIGGATEETIIARVGEGIVTTIGSAKTHQEVLENPDLISKRVLEKGLDSGTAFEILSIDIADLDVGRNIGSELQAAQAEADKKVAQAKAEERRAMAVAEEQEMRARIEENRAKVVLAEAEIPKAIAEAFRGGNLGVMDYYRMKNIQSDTDMRKSISEMEEGRGQNQEED
ncbi:MAG: flotillin-like protein FloA [Candidatus Omnitrophica bacterium]|nr:flotillin-like protein FloA [Candidatus Omnitrophota bacterium]